MERKTASILFSDIEGYSRLDEAEIRVFLEQVIPDLANLVKKYKFIEINTWGDGLIVVSEDPYSLARFALDLRDFYNNENWGDKLLPELQSRISLHGGAI